MSSAILVSHFALAAPSVQQLSGALAHQGMVTISGSGFGSKSTAAPHLWDDASGTSLSSKWDLAVPNAAADANYNVQYRPVGFRNVAGPHPNAKKYIVGGHGSSWNPYAGGEVMISKAKSSHSNGDVVYARAYLRVDPAWQFASTAADNNHKWFVMNFGGKGPYEDDYFYIDYDQGKFNNPSAAVQHKYSPAPGHALRSPDVLGHSNWWNTSPNPASQWVLHEVETKLSTGSDGYLRVWTNGSQVMNYSGPTDTGAHSDMAVAFGGYSSTYVISPRNNFRYFADVYIDYTPARVILANNADLGAATIREVQIPSRWADTSIDVSVNLGKFSSGQTAYLFVVNGSNSRNSVGYPVTVGGTSTAKIPSAPTSVTAN
jgi:hypothetical protein